MYYRMHMRAAVALLGVAAISPALSAQRVSLPAGTVIIGRTTSALQSANAQPGQSFETTVEESVGLDGYTVIPSGSRMRGVVTTARAATRQQSGVIEVTFNRLMLADGSSVAINGKLTSTDSAERRQIKSDPNAHVVLVGGRGGIGAAIAGAGSQGGSNNLLAALGGLLSEGRDVDVPAGTPLAVELVSGVMLRGGRRSGTFDENTIYTASDRVLAAQQALAQRGYYRGAGNGRMDDATRRALFQFQADQRLNATGNLDGRTARALGITVAGGVSGTALSADDASSIRRDASAIAARARALLGIAANGRSDASRTYSQVDVDLLFAFTAFAENAATYEEMTRSGGNQDAVLFAGRSLVAAARRVDAALQATRAPNEVQSAWDSVRRRLAPIDQRQ